MNINFFDRFNNYIFTYRFHALMLLITQSVDNIVVATEAAFVNALLVTNKGSIIPAFTISTVFPVTTSNPMPSSSFFISLIPALFNINS
uniref:Molecular chaperone GroEL n=1 Tax=uncultured marine virus TaxID=186617 RepID=A0A0F7LBS9_9VIRU|nr:molecular chaperone GroEL [uncultured marine virus]